MGQYWSSQASSGALSREEFEQWRRSLDADGDGSVTRAELQRWQQSQGAELEALRAVNRDLERQLLAARAERPASAASSAAASDAVPAVSRERIDELVERLLQNHEVNIKLLPDAVERHLYRNMFNLLLNLLGEVLESSSVQLLGHEVQFKLAASAQAPQTAQAPSPAPQPSSAAESQEESLEDSSSEALSEETSRLHRLTQHFRREK